MERIPIRNAIGRSPGDGKSGVTEKGAIGDESVEGPMLGRGQQV